MSANVLVSLGEPVVVAQAAPDVKKWGYCQFPTVEKLGNGDVFISYHFADDSATAYGGGKRYAVTSDEGRSFRPLPEPPIDSGLGLPNGDRIRLRHLPSIDPSTISLPKSVASYKSYGHESPMYDAADFPPELSGYPVERMAAGSGIWRTEIKQVAVPAALRYVASGVFPHQMFWRMRIAPDGAVWGIAYPYVLGADGKPHTEPVFAISRDGGETFSFLSKIDYVPLPEADEDFALRDSFTEPDVAFMPDGSIICILRTENGVKIGHAPMYICRSVDGGLTWSRPLYFDHLGVWPTLQPLNNGVTLVCYGRPGLFLRATSDKSGTVWDDRVTILPIREGKTDTCSYAELVALNDSEALLVYSDFNFPNPDDVPVKSILARRVTTAV